MFELCTPLCPLEDFLLVKEILLVKDVVVLYCNR